MLCLPAVTSEQRKSYCINELALRAMGQIFTNVNEFDKLVVTVLVLTKKIISHSYSDI